MRPGYRSGVAALAISWGVIDTATTLLLVSIGMVDSHPVVNWLIAVDPVAFVLVKVYAAALVGVALLAGEEHICAVPFAAVWLWGVVAVVLVLGPATHAYVWYANGFPPLVYPQVPLHRNG